MCKFTQLSWVAACLLLSAPCQIGASAEDLTDKQNELLTLLTHTVLAEGQALADVRKSCDRRIAVMPRDVTWSAWQREAELLQRSVLDNVVFRNVPSAWRDSSRRIEWLDVISGGPGYRIKKLRYEAIPGL